MSNRSKALVSALSLALAAGVGCGRLSIGPRRPAGGLRIVLQAKAGTPSSDPQVADAQMQAVEKTLKARALALRGVVRPTVQRLGRDQVEVILPGLQQGKQEAIGLLTSYSTLEFYWLRDVRSDRNPTARWEMYKPETDPKTGIEIYTFENTVTHEIIRGDKPETQKLILQKVVNAYDPKTNPQGVKPLLTGADMKPNARADSTRGSGVVVNVEFNQRGTQVFRAFTQRHVGEVVAIVADGRILTAPIIREPIVNGKAIITGFATSEEAQRRAQVINSGALPVPLWVVSVRQL